MQEFIVFLGRWLVITPLKFSWNQKLTQRPWLVNIKTSRRQMFPSNSLLLSARHIHSPNHFNMHAPSCKKKLYIAYNSFITLLNVCDRHTLLRFKPLGQQVWANLKWSSLPKCFPNTLIKTILITWNALAGTHLVLTPWRPTAHSQKCPSGLSMVLDLTKLMPIIRLI